MEDNPYAPPKSNLIDVASTGPITLYSPKQIQIAAFLGGPLAGTWFLSRNFRLLSRHTDCTKTLVIGGVSVIGLFPLLFVIPKHFPQVTIPLAYSYLFYYFAQRRFVAEANKGTYFAKGWQSWLNVIGVTLLWVVPTILIGLVARIFTTHFFPNVLK